MRRWKQVRLLCVTALAAACDLPTDPPILEQSWALPLDELQVEQDQFLPARVTTVGDSLYSISVDDLTVFDSLGSLCAACVPLDGLPLPTPAFTASATSVDALPDGVASLSIARGSFDVTVTNDLGFDPLLGGGSLQVVVRDAGGSGTLATLTLDGATETLPNGTSVTRTVSVASATVTGATETELSMVHAGGAATTIDIGARISTTVVVTELLSDGAEVDVDGTAASFTESTLDTDAVSGGVLDAVRSGSLSLDVTNPFGAGFSGTVTVAGVSKPLAIGAAPTSVVEIALTAEEMRSILSTTAGTVTAAGVLSGGPASVTPGAVASVDPTLHVTLEVGR